jgi:hypothetical protein
MVSVTGPPLRSTQALENRVSLLGDVTRRSWGEFKPLAWRKVLGARGGPFAGCKVPARVAAISMSGRT